MAQTSPGYPGAARRRRRRRRRRLEDACAQAAYGQHSSFGKISSSPGPPGRIHIVLIRQPVGF
jgi:hypothetical protein